MTQFINLTPETIRVYPLDAFVNLEFYNGQSIADSVDVEQAIACFESQGEAYIETRFEQIMEYEGITLTSIGCGYLMGLPPGLSLEASDFIIVRPDIQFYAKASDCQDYEMLLSPELVIRRTDGQTLGCTGFRCFA